MIRQSVPSRRIRPLDMMPWSLITQSGLRVPRLGEWHAFCRSIGTFALSS